MNLFHLQSREWIRLVMGCVSSAYSIDFDGGVLSHLKFIIYFNRNRINIYVT